MGKFERRKRKLEHSFRTLCKHSNSNFPKCQMREVAESLPWITTTFNILHVALWRHQPSKFQPWLETCQQHSFLTCFHPTNHPTNTLFQMGLSKKRKMCQEALSTVLFKNPCCNTSKVQHSIHQYPISLLSYNSLKLFQTSQIMNRLGFQVNHFVINRFYNDFWWNKRKTDLSFRIHNKYGFALFLLTKGKLQ